MSTIIPKNRFTPPADWSASLLHNNPIFAGLCRLFPLNRADWPDITEINRWHNGSSYQFVDNKLLAQDGRYYEEFIYATTQIPTRKDNWHDFFGALIWHLFPQTKARLNCLHMAEIEQYGLKQRSPLRNKLTLFDECGVLIACEPQATAQIDLLRQHQWRHSFWQQRQDWWHSIKPVVFGHAIYEMATQPFIGLTAKCWFIEVPAGFCQWPDITAYSFLDQKLCEQIADCRLLLNNQQLTPLPLLGIPGWDSRNEQEDFYNNINYFRPLRQR